MKYVCPYIILIKAIINQFSLILLWSIIQVIDLFQDTLWSQGRSNFIIIWNFKVMIIELCQSKMNLSFKIKNCLFDQEMLRSFTHYNSQKWKLLLAQCIMKSKLCLFIAVIVMLKHSECQQAIESPNSEVSKLKRDRQIINLDFVMIDKSLDRCMSMLLWRILYKMLSS